MLITATFISTAAVLQAYILPKDILKHFGFVPPRFSAVLSIDGNSGFARVRSFLRGPNELGAYLITPFIFVIALLQRLTSKKIRIALSFLIVILTLAIYVSYSRSAWIGLIAAFLIYFSTTIIKSLRAITKKTKGKIAVALVTALAVFGLSIFMKSDTYHIVILHDDTSNTIIGSTTARLNNVESIKKDTLAHPFGLGPGTSGPASYYGTPRIPDNYYIQIIQEYGFAGLLLFAAINIYVAYRLWKMRQNTWALVALAALIGISLSNVFLHNWADDTVALFFWGFAGWVFGTNKLSEKRHEKITL